MRFEWDEVKNGRNLRKHKIRFETAKMVFDDPHALSDREREVDNEERWQTVGAIAGSVTVVVAYTYKQEDAEEVIRIIPARKAGRRKGERMKKVNGRLAKEIENLCKLRDEDIDFSDIPEKRDWTKAVRGKFYRPVNEMTPFLPSDTRSPGGQEKRCQRKDA
jgi:hypothetical protein